MSSSCVTMTMVMPWSFNFWNTPMISMLVWLSRLPVGSSASSKDGRFTSARAMATRCCWPPESWLGWWSARGPRPTSSSACMGAFALLVRLDAVTVVKHRHLDIFQRRRARKQVETLEDEADFFVADIRERIAVERGNVNAIEQIIAAARTVERADHVHQRAFAGAARAHEGHEFARKNFQRNPAHRVDIHFAGVIHLVDVRELDDGIGLHGKSDQRILGKPPPQRVRAALAACVPVKTTPVTTCAPSSSPESTSVEMPSLMPVLICTACSFASSPVPEST